MSLRNELKWSNPYIYIVDQSLWQGLNSLRTKSIYYYLAIFVVISVCLFVCLSDHNSKTLWQICLKFWLGKSGHGNVSSLVWDAKMIGSTFNRESLGFQTSWIILLYLCNRNCQKKYFRTWIINCKIVKCRLPLPRHCWGRICWTFR